ncbi:MAG: exodeoxyribonuclease VII large subunit [Planctomycetaceae bacterium]|nr:exodeoxyribonuclease VII large subunit [Planctomycetaceae bacterium]
MDNLPVISVTELITAFKEVVETALPPCCVEAEISNCKKSPAGHVYLTLKDEQSEISAVLWRSAAARLKFQPKDGMRVLAAGALQVYVARGTCQFIINRLLPTGVGELEMAFRQLKEKLEREGLFEAGRKRPIPRIPQRIALVTSPTGAAVRDMIQVITRRWPVADIVVVPVRVQGEGAAAEVARALNHVHLIRGVDVVIAGRGGGSLEDLWCFNEEIVARAIAACRIPVISAVGHEVDVSIADLVADRRALTPSEAGELVVPSVADLRQSLNQLTTRLSGMLRARVETARLRIQSWESRSVFQRPMTIVDERRQRCDELAEAAQRAIQWMLERRRQQLTATAASLDALSPLKVLSRGYSLTLREDGTLVRDASTVTDGDILKTRLANGTISSVVIDSEH